MTNKNYSAIIRILYLHITMSGKGNIFIMKNALFNQISFSKGTRIFSLFYNDNTDA